MAYDKGNKADSPMKRRGGRRRKRKNSSKKNHRKLCKTSESSYSSYQESKTYRFNAIRTRVIL